MSKTEDPIKRRTVSFPESLWDDIDRYRHGERIGTEVEALRRLVQSGLRAEEGKAKPVGKGRPWGT